MKLQYITDDFGHKNAVLLSMTDWSKIQKDIEELRKLRNKKLFLAELSEAIEDMKLVKQGKLEARNAEELLNEL